MSWIVQNLWNNREEIKNQNKRGGGFIDSPVTIYTEESEFNDESLGYEDPCIESDEFNDLLMIEKAVDELKELGLLSKDDLITLYDINDSGITRNQRYWHNKRLYYICQRIAYYLGGYFTDEGYINYLTKKYHLTPEQQEVARDYMRSKFKNKTLSKGHRIENNNEKFATVSAQV